MNPDSTAPLDALPPSRPQGEEEDPRRCSHVREDGARCKGWKTSTGKCPGHSGIGLAASPQAAAEAASLSGTKRQAEAQARSEARKPLRDQLAARLEERADQLITRLMQIVDTGTDADALRAIDAMLSRVYGRPKETVEVQAPVEEPETMQALRSMTIEQRADLLRTLEQQGRIPLQLVAGD